MTKTAVDKAERKGREEGRAEESARIAKILKSKGIDLGFISDITGLPISTIEGL